MEKHRIIKAYVNIPPGEREQSASYKFRIADYLYCLLHGEYKGKANEVDTAGAYAAGMDDKAAFHVHHLAHGWNLELALETRHEREAVHDVEFSQPFQADEWTPASEMGGVAERPDYIHWSRVHRGQQLYLRAYLIKYFRHYRITAEGMDEINGVLIAEQSPVDKRHQDGILFKIGRTARTLSEMLKKRSVENALLLTVDGREVELPEKR
ncbi:hypothetical protein HY642_03325 [Candidatus Woesearchaeota archaeon]|nr:hypothetical protein [Candidatus Woesearchaeota archaeon]